MKVSICTITYNQEKFIAHAIESVLMQETDFPFELVIGEDCSTDGTRQVCIGYHDKYPNRIRLLPRERNLGMLRNFVQTFQACTGQYVAILEGDDYWTSAQKLQKQADFLDTHPDYAVCFSRTMCFSEDGRIKPWYIPIPKYEKHTLTMEDLLRCDSIATCSVMFRNRLFDSFPDWFFSLRMGDWPLHIMNAQHGKVAYLPETMAAYRVHRSSNYSSLSAADVLLGNVDFYEVINRHLHFEYDPVVKEMLAETYQALAIAYFSRLAMRKAARCAIQSLRVLPRKHLLCPISRRNLTKAVTKFQRARSR